MSSKRNKLFFVGLPIALVIAFSIHVYLHSAYNYDLFGNFIIASYLFNFGFVLLEVRLLNLRRMKEGANLGNVYLSMSMLKFLVFFAVFLPLFKLDGVQDRFEYFGFFVPYAICLVAGTAFLIHILKQSD
jgi:CDP-diglyceride synthetase